MILLERMAKITDLIGDLAVEHVNEYDLQAGIFAALEAAGHAVDREVVLSEGSANRIDMFVNLGWLEPGIGIEVKVEGSAASVNRQLARYADEDSIAGLILVTTRSKHHHIPTELNAKPVRLCTLIGAAL